MPTVEIPQLVLPQSQIRRRQFETIAAAEAASFLAGETCSILETRRDYQFDAASSAVRDGSRVLAPAGGGRLLATNGLVQADGVHLIGDGSPLNPIDHSEDAINVFKFFTGTIINGKQAVCSITSNGTTVTASVQAEGGGDIRYVTLDGYATLDCTPPATVTLTPGSDSTPVDNYIYIDILDGTLKKSTTGFPATSHVPIERRLIPSASFVQSYGTYSGNNQSDHVFSDGDNGHLTHINQNFRSRPPVYLSGAEVTISGSGTGTCTVAVASGSLLMAHERTTYSFANGSSFLVVNDQSTPFQRLSNLFSLATDTANGTLTGRWAAHFLWYGHCQESGGGKLYLNKPSGSYLDADLARSDSNGYFNSSVPPSFRGCAIGLRRIVARKSATGVIDIDFKSSDDWRGKLLASVPGSGGTTSFSSVFPSSQFRVEDDTDASKKFAVNASAIGTGQTRNLLMPDRDVDLAPASREATASQSGLMSAAQAAAVAAAAEGSYAGGFGAISALRVKNNATNPNYQVDINADGIVVRNGSKLLQLFDVDLTVDITASGANGLDTGTESSNNWYYIWVIYNPATATTAGLLSASSSAPTLPSGYAYKKFVSAVLNNSSSNFKAFSQRQNEYTWVNPVESTPGYYSASYAALTPPNAPVASGKVGAVRIGGVSKTANAVGIYMSEDGTNMHHTWAAASGSSTPAYNAYYDISYASPQYCSLNSGNQIYYKNHTNDSIDLYMLSFLLNI